MHTHAPDPLPLDVDLITAGFVHRMHTHVPDLLPLGEVEPKRGRGSAKFTIREIYICAIRPCPSPTVASSRCVWSIVVTSQSKLR